MKLLDRYNRLNIIATILTFLVGSCTFYFVLHYILIHQLDETLQTEQQEIFSYVAAHNKLPEIIRTRDQYITYQSAAGPAGTVFRNTKNTFESGEQLREVEFTILVNGSYYIVRVDKPLEETESLLQLIIAVTVVMIALILLTGYLINSIVIKKLWRPFYHTIGEVKAYHLADTSTVKLDKVDIDEFSLLNQAINEMIERIQQDYSSLKNFTGQAAHEMQTPLAIIRAKLDTLVQNESLLEKNATNIADIEKAVQRLSRLHQSLLLLTRVENRQFILDEEIALDKIIVEKSADYADMAQATGIDIVTHLQPTNIKFHQQLAEIVIGNLLNNAIRYNVRNGIVDIALQDRVLHISNTSAQPGLDCNRLFKRFYRENATEEGTGLGLSIVKQVCDMAGYTISYQFAHGRHDFAINFTPNF